METEEKMTEEMPEEAPEETTEPAEEPAAEEPVAEEPKAEDEAGKLSKANEELTDRLKRTMAEFDNYRKRTEKEKAVRFDMGRRDVVEKLLPVLDNFERGLGGLTEEQKKEPFADGMDKVLRQLEDIFKGLGVEPIEAVGQPFNPDLHNAVMHVEDEELGENTVAEEFQKGYTMGGTVIRYSMVKVAN